MTAIFFYEKDHFFKENYILFRKITLKSEIINDFSLLGGDYKRCFYIVKKSVPWKSEIINGPRLHAARTVTTVPKSNIKVPKNNILSVIDMRTTKQTDKKIEYRRWNIMMIWKWAISSSTCSCKVIALFLFQRLHSKL